MGAAWARPKLSMLAEQAPKFRRLESGYLLPPLDSELHFTYRVTIANMNGRSGVYVLTLDPNSAILDDFGQPLGCTLMADFEFEVRLEHVASKAGEELYDLTSPQPLPARFRLVLSSGPPSRCPAQLLTLDADGQITQIVHLHP
jgi:hypothetical protein